MEPAIPLTEYSQSEWRPLFPAAGLKEGTSNSSLGRFPLRVLKTFSVFVSYFRGSQQCVSGGLCSYIRGSPQRVLGYPQQSSGARVQEDTSDSRWGCKWFLGLIQISGKRIY